MNSDGLVFTSVTKSDQWKYTLIMKKKMKNEIVIKNIWNAFEFSSQMSIHKWEVIVHITVVFLKHFQFLILT